MQLPANYFQLFEIDESFQLDTASIEQTYRKLQREYHPDRYAHEDEQTQLRAVQAATHINEAFQTLKSPVRRAQYLLSLRGVETGEESRRQLPMDFLVKQMELRESLAEAQHAEDPFEVLESLAKQGKALLDAELDAFALALSDDRLEHAEESVRKLQFLTKLQTEIENAEERLDEEF